MICRYYQWRISAALDSDDPSARLPEQHLRLCPACREFLERSLQMAEALREEPVPVALRIVRDEEVRPAYWIWRPSVVRLAAAACVALIVLVPVMWRLTSPKPRTRNPNPAATVSLPTLPALSAEQLLAQVREPVESLTAPASEPLKREIELAQDRVAAVGRDMIACLPTGFMPRAQTPN